MVMLKFGLLELSSLFSVFFLIKSTSLSLVAVSCMYRCPVKECQVSWLVLGTKTLNGTHYSKTT